MKPIHSYGMKMTLDIDEKKVEEAMAEYGVGTKTEMIDLALKELLRKKAVERLMGSIGEFPNMITNEELEAPGKRHLARARRCFQSLVFPQGEAHSYARDLATRGRPASANFRKVLPPAWIFQAVAPVFDRREGGRRPALPLAAATACKVFALCL
jgi:hypothetical protein